MILKGGVRADALALGKYLLESKNERVEIGALDGFNSSDLLGCMAEVDAIAAGVKSRQYLFSLSLNPPAHEAVGNDVYEDAVTRIKAKFGLEHQPHALVYHENAGRRHGHLVISRIDPETMTVKRLGKWKEKLQQVSKELFLDNGMTPPKGLIDRRERDINAFSYADWQACKRADLHPHQLQMLVREAWSQSPDRATLETELQRRGLFLSSGDRRPYVVMSHSGEVFSLPNLLAKAKTRDVVQRLGDPGKPNDPNHYRGVDQTRQHIREILSPMLRRLLDEARQDKMRDMAGFDLKRHAMNTSHALERARMDDGIRSRAEREQRSRASKLSHGLEGLWQVISGKARAIHESNIAESYQCLLRDRRQRDDMVAAQLAERRALEQETQRQREHHFARLLSIHRDYISQQQGRKEPPRPDRDAAQDFNNAARDDRTAWLQSQQRESQSPAPAISEPETDRTAWLRSQERGQQTPEPQERAESVKDRAAWLHDQQRGDAPTPERDHEGPDLAP